MIVDDCDMLGVTDGSNYLALQGSVRICKY